MSALSLWKKECGARHGRDKEILRDTTGCDVCRRHAVCLGFDPSEDEYGPVWICFPCMTSAVVESKLPGQPMADATTKEKP